MKKLFLFFMAVLMTASMFASREVVPTDADLKKYATGTYTMCIYNEEACNGIVLNGTYAGWPSAADHATLLDFIKVEGFEGWYVVSWNDTTGAETKDGGVQAKPVHLDAMGLFNWDYQLGNDAELIRGTELDGKPIMNLIYNEVDIKNIQPGILVIDVKSWKNNPCTVKYHTYNITLVSPDCNDEDFITPAISGGFNGWAQEAMTLNELKTAERQYANLPGGVFEYSVKAAEGTEFKFRSSEEWGKDWSNLLKEYDAKDDEWKNFSGAGVVENNEYGNLVLGEMTNLVFDLGNPEQYTWEICEKPEPIDSTVYKVLVAVNIPANGPEAGVELMGDFGEDTWNTGLKMELITETGWYVTELETMGFKVFKFRELDNWYNQIVYADKVDKEGKPVILDNMKFQDYWVDDTYKGDPIKMIELDFSDATKYVWKSNYAKYIVTFVDYDGRIISQQFVPQGGSASAPSNPYREGYLFAGWDKEFSNVTSDLTITAKYDYGFKLIDGVNYYLKSSDSTALVVNGGNYSGNIVIPEKVSYDNITFKVIAIYLQAFYNCDGLKSIVIPASVTYIGDEAFYNCDGLKSITMLSETPAIIESNTFGYYYDTQKVIYVPCGTMETYQNAWSNYTEQIRYLPKTYDYTLKAEANDRNMGYVQLPSSACDEDLLTAMPYNGYHFVRWSDGVTANPRPFVLTKDTTFTAEFALDLSGKCGQDSALTWIYEPENQTLTISGNGALTNYYTYRTAAQKYAKNIIAQKGITAIGYEAFNYCDSLQSIAILNGNASLEEDILYRSLNVQNIEAPAGIFAGPEYYYVPGLTYEVNIDFTHKLQTVKINGGKMRDEYFTLLGNSQKTLQTLDLSAAEMESFPESALADYRQLSTIVLPYGLKNINYAMAANCYYLQAILIPAGVTEIDDRAFDNCRSLASVEFAGNAVKRIGDWSFYNCHELANIVIPEGVTEIGKAAFYGCAYAKAAHLPASLQSIGDNGFAGCSKMAQMIVDAVVPPTVGPETFDEVSTEAPVYVPEESVEAYQSHPVWGKLNIVGDKAPQGIEDVQTNGQFTKVLRDGQIVILRGDKIYTVTGQEVK